MSRTQPKDIYALDPSLATKTEISMSKYFRFVFLFFVGAAFIFAGISGTTYEGFNPNTNQFNLQEPIAYSLPNASQFGPGPYPVFLWIPGTYEFYGDNLAQLFMAQMNARGFLAASVSYSNTESNSQQTCAQYQPRAQGIFNAASSTSAVSVVCSLTGANCNPSSNGGIVVGGASQGGLLAVQGKNYAPNVQAVFAMSIGDFLGQQLTCVQKANIIIPTDRLTVVNGVADPLFQPPQFQLQGVTGLTCASGSTQCWSPDGSGAGWYIVQNSQVASGSANHCYFIDDASDPCNPAAPLDPGWLPPSTFDWSLSPNLDWLSGFGRARAFSSTGH
jgi:hypothetical protein